MTVITRDSTTTPRTQTRWSLLRRLDLFTWLGVTIVLALILCAIFAPLLAPYDPNEQNILLYLAPPSAEHLLGTDQFGRDILSRLLYGARYSLTIGFLAIVLALVVGSFLGMIAGYVGRKTDIVVMQIMDVVLAFPSLILGLALVALMGATLTNIVIAIAFTAIPAFARIARAGVLTQRNREYVQACHAMDFSNRRILFGHILPAILPEIMVMASLWMATAVRTEASLAFIGLGLAPPTPTWGGMVREGFDNILNSFHLALYPSLAILILVLALNLIGDGLRDAIDPRLKDAS
ncbi:ABC transporter permease [Daeguia caeni]|uniref:ABC transporter permease n=1 Tax=Daeguia caeni TaxID=439612 RepID=A0ABV9H9F9_9HYPH